VGHFPFALIQRSQIVGVATEGLGAAARAEARLEADRGAAEPAIEEAAGESALVDDALL
jgi:hypothetical protein